MDLKLKRPLSVQVWFTAQVQVSPSVLLPLSDCVPLLLLYLPAQMCGEEMMLFWLIRELSQPHLTIPIQPHLTIIKKFNSLSQPQITVVPLEINSIHFEAKMSVSDGIHDICYCFVSGESSTVHRRCRRTK